VYHKVPRAVIVALLPDTMGVSTAVPLTEQLQYQGAGTNVKADNPITPQYGNVAGKGLEIGDPPPKQTPFPSVLIRPDEAPALAHTSYAVFSGMTEGITDMEPETTTPGMVVSRILPFNRSNGFDGTDDRCRSI